MKRKKGKISSKRYDNSYNTRDGGGKKSFLDFKKVDKKIDFFEPSEGLNKVNIIPYEIKTKNHPLVKKGISEIGDFDYNLDLYVHRGIGANNDSVICPKGTYGKTCPICEEKHKLYDAGKNDEAKELKAQRRCVYNIQPIVKGKSEGLKIWDVSHSLFEKELIEEAHSCLDGSNIIDFADSEDGKIIKFRGTEAVFGKTKYLEFKSFSFLDRDEEIDEDILDEAVSLDELLTVPTYEEVSNLFYGIDSDDDEDKDDEEEEEEEEKPTKKHKHKRTVKNDSADDEDEEEDDEEEDGEEPEEKPAKKSKKEKCPHDHKFGVDTDEYKECESCELWDDCMEELDG